jgi:proteasome accessory factor C
MTASDQLRRLLAILPRLADGQEHRIVDIAERLGVDAGTVERDLFELSERAGDPPGWIETVTLFMQGESVSMEAPGHFKRPMRLSASEARTLELGLSLLRAERPPEKRLSVDAAIERLRALVSPEPETEVPRSAVMGRRNTLTHVDALRDALRNRMRVRIRYHKGSAEAPDERTICPFTFAVEQGVWYLVAFCEKSDGIRIFRTDRIERIELLAESFERPEGLDVDGSSAAPRKLCVCAIRRGRPDGCASAWTESRRLTDRCRSSTRSRIRSGQSGMCSSTARTPRCSVLLPYGGR